MIQLWALPPKAWESRMDLSGEMPRLPLISSESVVRVTPRARAARVMVLAWRQWNHWNLAPGLARLKLPKGKSVLTVHIVTEGQMNLATFDFKKAR